MNTDIALGIARELQKQTKLMEERNLLIRELIETLKWLK